MAPLIQNWFRPLVFLESCWNSSLENTKRQNYQEKLSIDNSGLEVLSHKTKVCSKERSPMMIETGLTWHCGLHLKVLPLWCL